MTDAPKRWLKAGISGVLIVLITALMTIAPIATCNPIAIALPQGNAITDGKALLRYALPIDNPSIRQLQSSLEGISDTLRVSRKRLSSINGNLTQADRIVAVKAKELLNSVPADRQPEAEALIAGIKDGIADIRANVETQNREAIWIKRAELLDRIGQLEALMVGEFPFSIPAEYSDLPQLKGRATIEVTTNKGVMKVIVDGYSAPITAGNFVDLVQRGFYDGLEFTRAEESYVVQIGDPPGKADGFIDPVTGKERTIPLEVLVKGDKEPTYGITLEDAGRYLAQPVLPFSAYGTVAMARPGNEADGGSSQFFFFLFEPELTPAGLNLLDGRYAVFGYVTEGKDVLEKLKAGDKIESAKVLNGAEYLIESPSA
jgi:peptidylprolyl isomerase